MRRTAVLLGLAVALMAGSHAAAQRRPAPARRDAGGGGFWWGVGLAPAWARVSCAICKAKRAVGISAFVGLGGATSRGLRIGAEVGGWRQRDGAVTQTLTAVGAAAYWFPDRRRRLYLKGGAAFVTHRTDDGTDVITSTGIGPQMGIGYRYPFAGTWMLSPFFHYTVGVFGGGVDFNGGRAADRATVSFVQVGVSLTRP